MKHRIYLVMGTLITGIFILAVFIFATSQTASAGNLFKFDANQSLYANNYQFKPARQANPMPCLFLRQRHEDFKPGLDFDQPNLHL